MMRHTVGDLYDRCVTFYPKKIAIKFDDTTYNYTEMQRKAYSLAYSLKKMGVNKGDRIALLMSNCPEYIFFDYAMAKLGVVRVSLAIRLTSSDLIYMMNLSECKVLVYHEKMAPRVEQMIPELKTVNVFICVSESSTTAMEGHYHLQRLMTDHPADVPTVEVKPEDLYCINFTGGTTGFPKGVMLSNRSWVQTMLTELLEFRLEYNEVFSFATPLTHAGGVLIIPVLIRGGTCLIMDHFDPKIFLQLAEQEKVTSSFLVPTMIYVLLDYPDLDKYDTSSWRNIIYGASAIAPDRLKQAITMFGPVFTQLYGQAEAPMAICVLPKEAHVIYEPVREKEIFSSCGRPCFPAQIKLIDAEGNEVPQGETGEIIVRHTNLMDGYLKDPKTTAETIRDGWLYTGDMAKIDHEGYIYIVDRSKDMIVSGGFNIYPREIEDVLHEHQAVKAAAVIGVPHEKWGEEVKAIVVLYEGKMAEENELIQFVKDRKGSLVVPKSVDFWNELPLTDLGKVDKKKMRASYWEGRDRNV